MSEKLGPLHGIKVLELGRVPPAEMPGMIFADMGADVLKIDVPPRTPLSEQARREAAHVYTNRNKRSIALNLKTEGGIAVLRKLAQSADVIIEGFRPGVMDRLGVGYDAIHQLNPRLVYCSVSGFGQDGPYSKLPAHDLNFIAMSGVLGLIGNADGKPAIPLNLVADYAGAAMHAALGVMFALFARQGTGSGQHVDISYLDTTVALLGAMPNLQSFFSDGVVAPRGSSVAGGSYPNYAIYSTRDGKFITIACSETKLWENFCVAIGRPGLSVFGRRPEHYVRAANDEESAARREVQRVMRTRDRDDWFAFLVQHDVCVGKVQDVCEVLDDPQLRHRGMFTEVQHPSFGSIRQFGTAIKMSDTPGSVRHAAPAPGENTQQVLQEMGFDADAITSLRRDGAL